VLADVPGRIVLDAGPLIGLLNRRDAYHVDALRGFEQLAARRAVLTVPVPILFEVFKWMMHQTNVPTARRALGWMLEDLDLIYLGPGDLHEMVTLLGERPGWTGSLEDTAVVQVAIRFGAPVWTLDYRDLRAFPNLQFWTPA
jgi:predicted nucleic acid-binding protein